MGRKTTIDKLPKEIKAYIQSLLAMGSMSLDQIIADLQGRYPVEAKTGELPSRSSLGRYGQKLSRRLDAIKASTEAAKLIVEHAGDQLDARSEALTALIQTELFESIIQLQEAAGLEDDAKRVELLSKAAKNIATLTRSSLNIKKFKAEVEEAARKELLEEQEKNLGEIAKAQGLDSAQVEFWKTKFLGLPPAKKD